MMNARYNLAMNRSVEQQQIREDAAVVLEAIAAEPTWDGYLMFQLKGLAARAGDDQLLCYAVDEVDEYSHEFDTRNLPRGGAKGLIDSYKREFEQIADALRAGMTWEKYKRANHISEGEELSIALKATLTRIRRVFKRHSRTSV